VVRCRADSRKVQLKVLNYHEYHLWSSLKSRVCSRHNSKRYHCTDRRKELKDEKTKNIGAEKKPQLSEWPEKKKRKVSGRCDESSPRDWRPVLIEPGANNLNL
jgi:hypothetical protein